MDKLLGKNLEELREAAVQCGLKAFVGNQLAEWLYVKRVTSWDAMTNIGKAAKAALQGRFSLGTAAPVGSALSSDGTRKYLFPVTCNFNGDATGGADSPGKALALTNCFNGGDCDNGENGKALALTNCFDGGGCDNGEGGEGRTAEAVEAVIIPDEDRRTLCVSSQAGCKMGCKFCMTGRQGWHGNLDAGDIINQFLSVDDPQSLTNAVFMGMGEPLDNYDAVRRAIEILTAPWGFAWSPKRITVSTIGVLPVLERFLEEEKCHLAVSLHNPFPDERLQMMPVQKVWKIEEVLALIRKYDFSGQRRVSFEYTMFAGFNDDKRHADALIRLLKGLECRVNLIRFHRIPDFPYDCAPAEAMEAFRDRLNNNGIVCTIRSSRGEDILAACGMLAGKHSQRL